MVDDVRCNQCSDGVKPCGCGKRPNPVYDAFIHDLEIAHTHAQRALDALYSPLGLKRSILYRMALGRAQSLLIGLYVQELQRRKQRGIDHRPAEPDVADGFGDKRQ